MSGVISTYVRNGLYNLTFLAGSFAPPSDIYFSLHDGDPANVGANEVSGGGYARVLVPSFDAPTLRVIRNTAAVIFPALSYDLGVATHVGAWDAASGGNFLWQSDPIALPLSTGSTPQFDAANITIGVGEHASTYLAGKWLDHVFRASAYTSPGADIYVSLHTSPPQLTGASEVLGNSYARVQNTDWDSPTDGAGANSANVQFPTPTGNWGELQGAGIWDSSSSGNFLCGAMITPYEAQLGDTAIGFGIGSMSIEVL